ncbi:MAG: SIS domain-containing protein [Lachnospiraceae bacterium]|jgi:glucoselysine-6-phosphate deglycase|nr:SIS domain-containing protein [Lachnospiraceae bacterium]
MVMMDYILEQTELFRKVLSCREEEAAAFCDMTAQNNPAQICLIASGTSYNAACAAAPFMEMILGKPVSVNVPSQVEKLKGANPLAVVISQGGNSTNILEVFEKIQGIPTLVMTGDPGGHANTKGDCYREIPCGEETVGPKTKGYTITLLTLYLMALEEGKRSGSITNQEYNEYMEGLSRASDNLPENIERTREWVQANMETLCELKIIYMAGKRQGAKVAAEGALKVMETLLIPGVAYEFEEFLHGPASSLAENVSGFYLLPTADDPDYERMGRLINYHRNICKSVYTVGLEESEDKRDCLLKLTGRWYTQPFEQILPMQVISAVVTEHIGLTGKGSLKFAGLDAVMQIKAKNEEDI